MKYIAQLTEGERINEIYLCRKKQSALDAKIWDPGSLGIDDFDELDYIAVTGDVTSFQGAYQLNIKRLRKAQQGEYLPEDYLPCSDKDVDLMYEELLGFIQSVRAPYLRQLLESFFVQEEGFAKNFKFHSAAKSVHHGFVGGLLEHTLGVTKNCDYFAQAYPMLDRDLLITAAIFHDIGKLSELSAFPRNDYTDEGQLLGHIMIGAQMVSDRIRTIAGFPETKARELLHCILSHHGELEFGSPKKPALMEALALSFADNVDAKLETMKEALSGAGPANLQWQGYNRMLESNIRRTSPEGK